MNTGIRAVFYPLAKRLRAIVGRGRKAQLDEELQFHIAMSVQSIQSRTGVSASEARRLALIEFGGLERARDETYRQRPGWLLETLLQDARYAVRGFRRNPAFTITVVITLALGIGATTAVFSVVDRILFRALPYAHDDRLVSVGLVAPIVPVEFMLGGSYYVWQDNQKPFESLTSEVGVASCDLTERSPVRLSCASVEANFLSTLGVAPLIGRNFLPEEDRPNGPKAALISYGLWRSRYASNPGVLNQLIDIDGTETRVVGVLPKDFEMPTLEAADVLLPQALNEAAERKADPGRVMYAFARLKPGETAAHAQAALEPLFQYSLSLAPPGFRSEVHLRVRSIRDRQMSHVRLTAWVLFGAVLAVLLIGCGNVSGLMLARGAGREREIAVRSALGASRARLARQTLTEALLLSLVGALAGLAVAEVLVRVFVAIAPASLPLLEQAHLDLRILALTAALAVLCGLFFGTLAALDRPRSLAAAARTSGSGRSVWLRRASVATQIAVSMILLSASSLLLRSFWNMQRQDLGIGSHSVLTAAIELNRERYSTAQQQMQFFEDAQAALRRLPGVATVAISDSLPPAGPHRESVFQRMIVAGRPRQADAVDGTGGTGGMVAWRSVTPDYFRALDIPIERGRDFREEDSHSPQNLMILSKLLADRLFPGQDPVGQRVRPSLNEPEFTVVGVAANVKNSGLIESDEPEYYRLRRNLPEDWGRSSTLMIETSGAPQSQDSLVHWVRPQIAAIDPTVPVEIGSMSQRVDRLAAGPRFQALLLSFFALTGLVMAMVGLYGLTAFLAAQRTHEIGIRMALGADRADMLRLIAGEGIRLIAIGGLAGMVVALSVSRLLKSLLFGVGSHDPATLSAVAALLALVALVATLIPARKAMRVDPAVALRAE
jgi:predicted permease